MILWLIAWRNLWAKPLQNLLTVAVVATALAMTVLVMLVAAFVGHEVQKRAYAHAIDTGYRFYSYGDACLLLPEGGA